MSGTRRQRCAQPHTPCQGSLLWHDVQPMSSGVSA
jgi:hypothetical protein